jgi:sporulation protein YlmC with PRC-barrel domain
MPRPRTARGHRSFHFSRRLVGYGADPGFAVDTNMREVDAGAAALLGNHDDAIASGSNGMNSVAAEALDWTRIQLNSAQREFLTQLPLTLEEGQRLFVHASAHAPEHWEYVTSVESASRTLWPHVHSQRSAVTFTSPPSSICHRPKKLPVSSRCNRLKSPYSRRGAGWPCSAPVAEHTTSKFHFKYKRGVPRKGERRLMPRVVVMEHIRDREKTLFEEEETKMLKKLMLSTVLSAAVATGAWAQSSSPMDSKPERATQAQPAMKDSSGKMNFVSSQKPDQWLATKFKGTDVLGSDNEKIGDVSDILFDKTGKVDAFIISVGGFLGVGSKEVALAPSSFDVVPGQNGSSDKLKIAATKDQLKDAQNFARYEPPRPTATTGSGTMGGGMKPAGSPSPSAR